MPAILVVDNEPALLDLLQEILMDEGYMVYTAQDGAAGLALLGQHAVDAVLLDIVMPGMDGTKVLAALAVSPWATIPVIVMSAQRRLEPLYARGANALLYKPFTIASALEVVADVLAGP